MSLFNNNLMMGAAGASGGGGGAVFDPTIIPNSVWMDGSADGFTIASGDMSDQDGKEFTLGTWFQLTEFDVTGALFCADAGSNVYTSLRHDDDNKIYFQTEAGSAILSTSNVFRDVGWYHMLLSVDTTQVVSSNRVRLFINGIENVLTGTFPAQDFVYEFNLANIHEVGDSFESGAFEGYLCQSFMIGSKSIQQGDFDITDFLDSFKFGTNGSQFVPKSSTDILTLVDAGSSNSFLLKYENSGSLGLDSSTNTNNFTATSMTSVNQSSNTASKVYPIINPLTFIGSASSTLEEGNTKATVNDNGGIVISQPLPFYDLWYFEVNVTSNTAWYPGIGQQSALGYNSTGAWNNTTAETHVWLSDHSGNFFNNNGTNSTYPVASPTTGRFAVAWDGDNRALYFGQISGSTITWTNSGDPTSGSSKTGAAPGNWPTSGTDPLYFITLGGGTSVMEFDFESGDWTGSTNKPTDAKELNSANLTAPDFQGIDYFDATLYEGNGGGQRVGDFVPFTDVHTVDKSAMFEEADKRYLSFTPSSGGDQKTFTFSTWFKLTNGASSQRNTFLSVNDGSKQAQINLMGDTSEKDINVNMYNGSTFLLNLNTDRAFLDESQWNHLVVAVDTRAAVASANKVKIYINGVQQSTNGTELSTNDYETAFNSDNEHNIGRQTNNGIGEPSWYLAETVMVDGSQLDPTSFGQVDTSTNRWIPTDVSGLTFGDEGWYLEYEGTFNSGVAATGAGKDSSGEGNNWAEENDSGSAWATSDQFIDTPTANFATIYRPNNITAGTVSEGNTKLVGASDSMLAVGWSENNLAIPSGKWFMEFATGTTTGGNISWGMSNLETIDQYGYVGQRNGQAGFTFTTGTGANIEMFQNNVQVATSLALGFTFVSADVGVIAYDADTKEMWMGFWDAGSASQITWIAGDFSATTTFPSTNPTFNIADQDNPTFAIYAANSSHYVSVNTGSQMVFNGASTTLSTDANGRFLSAAAIPTDFKAVNVNNLDDTASKITAFAWIKNRDATDNHMLLDRVRGVGKVLNSNNAAAEVTNDNTVQRFVQRGVQIGNDADVNTNNEDYVLWQWLLGDSASTGSTNEEGTINSTTLVADADHFSIVSYTGSGSNATVGHGLSAAPQMFIVRDRTDGNDWNVYAEGSNSSPASGSLRLDSDAAFNSDSSLWNGVPSATIINLGSSAETNELNKAFIAYCFRSIPGVCKVGTYVGNNTDDNAYISLGFRPRYFIAKRVDTGISQWNIFDTARQPLNTTSQRPLYANLDNAEGSYTVSDIDMLADGIKIRTDAGYEPGNTGTWLYMAMADIGGNGTLPPIYGR